MLLIFRCRQQLGITNCLKMQSRIDTGFKWLARQAAETDQFITRKTRINFFFLFEKKLFQDMTWALYMVSVLKEIECLKIGQWCRFQQRAIIKVGGFA